VPTSILPHHASVLCDKKTVSSCGTQVSSLGGGGASQQISATAQETQEPANLGMVNMDWLTGSQMNSSNQGKRIAGTLAAITIETESGQEREEESPVERGA
jgi:hypothetical protein